MKKIFLFLFAFTSAYISFAQTPIPADSAYKKNDTLRIGNILIIKINTGAKKPDVVLKKTELRDSRFSTEYAILDFGITNFIDRTNYAAAGTYIVNRPGSPQISEADFRLRGGKSININIWFFIQNFELVKRFVNLRYGLGIELNNYHFRSPVSFRENGIVPYTGGVQTNSPFVFRDSIAFSKNKLAADYFTIPLMLEFKTAPRRQTTPVVSAAFGVSGGYLYSQRNKQISPQRGKQKNKGDYNMERFKFSYIGELGVGRLHLYGSYTPKSIFEKGLNLRSYAIGIRIKNL